MNNQPKIIAFYLPQYHPTPHNDEWWGKGFTEWTNVTKAKPLFHGHYQPKVPADLGFYDLRLPEIREAQAELAKKAGIAGFCYYHYWFGNGHQELERPFNEVLDSQKPDYPFCLCWANESWHAKFWDKDGKATSKKVLAEQIYPGIEDNTKHFYSLLKAFKDKRYIKVEGKPLFMIYQPLLFKDIKKFISLWQTLAKTNGLPGIYFVGQTIRTEEIEQIISLGFDSVNLLRLHDIYQSSNSIWNRFRLLLDTKILHKPFVYSYKKAYPKFIGKEELNENVFPTLIPNWDHSPRSGKRAYILHNSKPEYFKEHATEVLEKIQSKKNPIVFLKSWNEWGEGNYMEPDLKYGHGYIEALRESIDKLNNS